MVYTSSLVRIEGGSIIVESSRQISADTSFAYGMEVASTLPRRGSKRSRQSSLKAFKSAGHKPRRRKR